MPRAASLGRPTRDDADRVGRLGLSANAGRAFSSEDASPLLQTKVEFLVGSHPCNVPKILVELGDYLTKGHCQSKFVYFAKTSEPDFAAIDFPAFFRVDLSSSMAAPSI
jgi:hypothetical protein